MESIRREFVIDVLSRMRKPTGQRASEKTVMDNVNRVMMLSNSNLLQFINDPGLLFEKLQQKYHKAPSLLSSLRPAMIFYGNLTQDEKMRLNLQGDDESILDQYARFSSELTQKRKEQKSASNANA